MMKKSWPFLAFVAMLAFGQTLKADTIPYPNAGTVAPTNVFTASATGSVTGYFAGANASNDDEVEMVDVTSGTNSGWLFPNHSTAVGASANFGNVTAGDTLEFLLNDLSLGEIFSSIPADSFDGINHVYETSWAGGTLNGASIPAGTYVGMEDLPEGISDFDYNDDTFVFANVATTSTSEPSSLVLLSSGLVGLGFMKRKVFQG